MAQSSSIPTRGSGNRIIKCAVSKCINNSFGLNALLKEQCDIHSAKTREFCGCPHPFSLRQFPGGPGGGRKKKQTLFWTFGWKF